MTVYVGDYALNADWTASMVGWRTNYIDYWRYVTLAEVIRAHPKRREEILRHHHRALALLADCQSKLQSELDIELQSELDIVTKHDRLCG